MVIDDRLATSYHYVGRLSERVHPMVIILYERRGLRREGRNAMFYDSHVEFIPEHDFHRRLAESLEMVKLADWDRYTPARRAAIEAFYKDALQLP
jgi:hypothetical protein